MEGDGEDESECKDDDGMKAGEQSLDLIGGGSGIIREGREVKAMD